MGLLQRSELVSQEDVLRRLVGADQRHLGVGVLLEDAGQCLHQRRDAGAAGDHAVVGVLVRLEGPLLETAFDVDGLAGLKLMQLAANLGVGVLLHQNREAPRLVHRQGVVGPGDHLGGLALGLGEGRPDHDIRDGDLLGPPGLALGQLEGDLPRVVRVLLVLHALELRPGLVQALILHRIAGPNPAPPAVQQQGQRRGQGTNQRPGCAETTRHG
mmetsp:Transcript_44752/g.133709  ORF Transcript_44752/g.133709 Transcript_44752/m.133709 type:complete len:214 (-) Transcript_44752:40-681(-)